MGEEIRYSEFLLLESFDISDKPLRMSNPSMKEYFKSYLSQKYTNVDVILNEIYKTYSNVLVFKLKSNSEEYILFLMERNGNIEVHFNNFTLVDFHDKTNSEGVPLKVFGDVFGDIFNIIYWYALPLRKPIVFEHNKADRLRLYKMMIGKVLSKHDMQWDVETSLSKLILTPKKQKSFVEKIAENISVKV